ncbi:MULTISPECIES: SRPBCC domain-containing protein [Chitinophagaceae]
MEKLMIKVGIQIQKPVQAVFDAIVNPEEMTQYFISKGSGKMETGKTLQWEFPEFEGAFPVQVKEVSEPVLISFGWDGNTVTTITLAATPENNTVVKITEGPKDNDEAGRKWLMQNTEGWANFLACLKAWVEYRIHLRVGAFDYMKGKNNSQ